VHAGLIVTGGQDAKILVHDLDADGTYSCRSLQYSTCLIKKLNLLHGIVGAHIP